MLHHKNIFANLAAKDHDDLQLLAKVVKAAGGRAYLVGGAVRDGLLNQPLKDLDVEVFGVASNVLAQHLSKHFHISEVGRSFGVFKLHKTNIDVTIPRRESKTGRGHKGFRVEGDPEMSFKEAASRRDFTINAIGLDLESQRIEDPFNGIEDLNNRWLRHVGPAFAEDPLRVLRGMQFVARFELRAAPLTIDLCRSIEPEDLSKERVFEEWKKLLLRGMNISAGLDFLQAVDWLRYFPELVPMIGCPQDPTWHPEGDVWTHTKHCLDYFAQHRIGDDREDLIVGLAILCHDIGKPLTTEFIDGRYRSPRHESVGVAIARSFLKQLTDEEALIQAVEDLVATHMMPFALYQTEAKDSTIRRLAQRVKRIDRLVRVAQADANGRPPLSGDFPAGAWLLQKAEELAIKDSVPKPILLGRHLIGLGLSPGPHFKEILDKAYEAQLEGEFHEQEEGLQWLKKEVPELRK